jgi:hypothetical protein
MGFIEAAFEDAPAELLAPENNYDLRVVNKEWKTSKSNRRMLQVLTAVEAPEDYSPINSWLVFPNKEDWDEDPDKAKLMLRNVQAFLQVFGIEMEAKGFNDDELDGATGNCLVIQEENEGEIYSRIRTPRLK